ncbi:hypothetical protein [Ensifer sp. MJa1]|uniref:hypothetical protein n=1 Tax=Ensifer sp. MJa1 TaxID=2919888 RepID=UPI00300BDD5D
MHAALRKALLVSTVGTCSLLSAPLAATFVAGGPTHLLSAAALAHDDDGDDRSGGDDRGDRGRDDSGRDDRDHNRGHDDRDDDNDDRDDDDDDHGGPGRHGDADDDDDDDDDGRHGRDDRGRPEIELRVSEESLRGLRDGSLIAVDNLGRVLEVEVEFEHGVRTVTVKPHRGDIRRNPGPIDSVSIQPAI